MNAYKIVSEAIIKNTEKLTYTPEMKKWFLERTKRHIELVQKYCQKIYSLDPVKYNGIITRGRDHDLSKYKDPEIEPYIHISWQYHMKDLGKKYDPPADVDEKINAATFHHVTTNSHHPEYHSYYLEDVKKAMESTGRDNPNRKMISAERMPDLDIAEMVVDWLAMSEEKKTDPIDWAKKNINVRWKFTPEQERLIYELIEKLKR